MAINACHGAKLNVSPIGDFTHCIMDRIGDLMHSVAPINEPWCVGWLSHFEGAHAPGLRDIRATARAMHHILVAHGTAIQTMRGLGLKNLGGVFNLEWAMPHTESDADTAAAEVAAGYYNRFFLGGVFKGEYPASVLEGLGPHLPAGWDNDFPMIQSPLDWCGIKYYTRRLSKHVGGAWPRDGVATDSPLPKTSMGWDIYPDALYEFLMRTKSEHTGDLPLFVTEHGMSNDDVIADGSIDDHIRIAYLNAHFDAARRAIADSIPLHGYFVWSLMDNYEWALGYENGSASSMLISTPCSAHPKPLMTILSLP